MILLFLFFGLILGINLSFRIGLNADFVISLLLLIGSFFLSIKKKRVIPFLVGASLGIVLGLIKPSCENDFISFSGLVVRSNENYFIIQTFLKRFYVYAKSHDFEVGDIIRINGYASDLSFTTYEGRFDFGSYLNTLGIFKKINLKNTEIVFSFPLRFRALEKRFLSHFDNETSLMLDCLLFSRKGESNYLSLASGLGLMQVVSSSGLIFGTLLKIIEKASSYFFKEKTSKIISICFGTLFLPLGLRKVGIIRVYVGRCLYLLFEKKKEKLEPYFIFALSGLLILALDYHYALQSGFLIGFGLSFFLKLSYVCINRYKGIKKKVITLLFIFIFMLPCSLSFSSSSFHPLSFLFGYLLLPLTIFTSALGYVSFISIPLPKTFLSLRNINESIFSFFSKIDISISLPYGGNLGIFIFYLALFVFMFLFEIGFKFLYRTFLFSLIGIYLISLAPLRYLYSTEVIFLNVGQGDCALIRRFDKVVMIDTGGNTSFDIASSVLIPFLREKRIYHIDKLILTHDDEDHSGGKDTLVSSFPVKEVIDKASSFPFSLGDLTFLNLNDYGYESSNESSLVVYSKIKDKRFLFMGDAPSSVEKRILEDNPSLTCDILKVGHHGSSSSSSLSFLKSVKPSTAVISVGASNSYGHPSSSVLERLNSLKIKIRRTDIEGTISYFFFG